MHVKYINTYNNNNRGNKRWIMDSQAMCRICREFICCATTQQLIVEGTDFLKLRHRIELLTGVWMENLSNVPQRICTSCRFDLDQAVAFRERCISTEVRLSKNIELISGEIQIKTFSCMCRICGEFIFSGTAKDIFKDESNFTIPRIELLTGLWLRDLPNMPRYICIPCSFDLDQAVTFRERCLSAQLRFFKWERTCPKDICDLKCMVDEREPCGNSSECNNTNKNTCNIKSSHSTELTEEHSYKCELCNNIFSHIDQLERHVCSPKHQAKLWPNLTNDQTLDHKVYEEKKPFKCELCDRIFPTIGGLRRHESSVPHRNKLSKTLDASQVERSFQCFFCDKKFVTSSNRTVHHRVHTGDRPYKCEVCNSSFKRNHHLRRHERRLEHKKMIMMANGTTSDINGTL
ncbi:zinc finger protein 708-like isoform X2 [Scaptodrosophila lebanonensis]|uniref:Zinc finger protein 708-like isoform X2 n=1 Tax=Drosophila lebanonensis TaxID=7225 RepID=A0A6J2TMC4_DROLE|nr:zinc finger protein 708-like isoform X2 [Scaptodrosophila lebanonensis]